MTPQFMLDEEGRAIPIPEPAQEETESELAVETPEAMPEVPETKKKDELADLFELPKPDDNDITTKHLFEMEQPDDLSELVEVSDEDVMGQEMPGLVTTKKPTPRYKVIPQNRRVIRRPSPPTITGGMES